MDRLFLVILNMSLTGAFVIAAICLVRLILKKTPKIISYCMWTVAGFRLVFPFSIESVYSLIPFKAQTIPMDIALQSVPRIDSGILFVNNAVSGILPAAEPYASTNPLQTFATIGAFVWLAGAAAMSIYGISSLVMLKRKMREASHVDANIYEAENIKLPFVLGVFNPGIYLPTGLSEREKSYVVLHEQTHIRRRDHIVKFAAYFILCLHWFNPLVWVAFLLMDADMEMSCDESVLKEMGDEVKKDYSMSLLFFAAEGRIIGGSPLAFGEGGIKERIKNVLNFRKTSRKIVVAATVLAAVLTIGFGVNRIVNAPLIDPTEEPLRKYVLENATEKQKMESMFSVTLYSDGTAILRTSLLSSYMLPDCTYAFEGSELLIYSNIETEEWENVFGVKNGEVIARFEVADSNTLVFQSAEVPLMASRGARYVYVSDTDSYIPRKWLDYYHDEKMPWYSSLELELPEYPGTVFKWTPYEVKAVDADGEKILFGGMPVWNVYLADITGDGMPELCATVSLGSGIVDDRIFVCDYAAGNFYDLEDRMYYDYVLFLDEGRLMVKQTKYTAPQGEVLATGELAIIDGKLGALGIDRTRTGIYPENE